MNVTFQLITDYKRVGTFSSKDFADLASLAENINPFAQKLTSDSFKRFFLHGGIIALACHRNSIVGIATIVFVYKFNGYSARLEHVSVLPGYQKNGIAKNLVGMLVAHINGSRSVRYIDLNCEPERETANRLYEKLGFKLRATNPRRLKLQKTTP